MSRTVLSRHLAAFSAFVLALGTAACGGEQADLTSDPSGRVTFELPDGWTEAPGSNGTRFSPPASAGIQVQVNTVDDDGRVSVADRRDAWLDFHRRNGAEILLEQEWPGGNFPGVEYAHGAQTARGEIVWHHVMLAGEGYVVATYLQAGPGVYEEILPVYRDIVASIRPAVTE
ncbi:MAG: hypothetical protein GVY32_10240 [Gammaproteobacteria bacterium]|jgi:hypothetical protein|nr:hypothetical protein [Gammaproteobacteria bacterium]